MARYLAGMKRLLGQAGSGPRLIRGFGAILATGVLLGGWGGGGGGGPVPVPPRLIDSSPHCPP